MTRLMRRMSLMLASGIAVDKMRSHALPADRAEAPQPAGEAAPFRSRSAAPRQGPCPRAHTARARGAGEAGDTVGAGFERTRHVELADELPIFS